jgi:hypothetical protein
MSDYLKRMIDRDLKRPDWAAIKARMEAMGPIELAESPAEMIRRERDAR